MKDLKMGTLIFLKIAFVLLFSSCTQITDTGKDLVLWYETPAENWMTEALPVGNGYMGVMFFGEPDMEHLQFSEGSLWAGGPGSGDHYNFGIREGASAHLEIIRELLRSGETTQAYRLTQQWMTGITHPREGLQFGDYGAQQTMGDLYVSVKNTGNISGYLRELNLKSGRGYVSYLSGNIEHQRTIFGCYPMQTMVYHFSNNSADGTDYFIELKTPHQVDSVVFYTKTLHLFGHVADNGLGFLTSVVTDTDGDVSFSDGLLTVSGARKLTLKHIQLTLNISMNSQTTAIKTG
jgi:alpha-L-fucosidase 2